MKRALLIAIVLCALAACSGGPAELGEDRPVTVLGPWTGPQGEAFEQLLRDSGIEAEYQGTAAQREVLLSQVQAGNPPDIAILPGPGELAEYARQKMLKDLGSMGDYQAPWIPQAAGVGQGKTYWVPVKATLKSIVWFRKGEQLRPSAAGEWCVGMGDDGASGWPGSDWIEDIVLQTYGSEIYEAWAGGALPWTDTKLRDSWQSWGHLFRPKGKSAEHALLNDHRGREGKDGLLFGGRERGSRCSIEHQGSFARDFYGASAAKADFAPSARYLPTGQREPQGTEVAADFAALFTDREQARQLLTFLTSEKGQRSWSQGSKSAVYSANEDVPAPKDDKVAQRIAKQLEGPGVRCLDASDVMPAAVRDAFLDAVMLYLAGGDLDEILKDLQSVQDAERKTLKLKAGTPWMTDLCS